MYKVFLVDDEPLFVDYLKSIIDWHTEGCQLCGSASDGEQALQQIGALRPDVVLMDINIPLLSGLEVCQKLREQGVPSAVAIVSAHNDFQFARTAIKYGVSDYLLKPFDRAELLQTLHSCFAKARAQRGLALRKTLAGQGAAEDAPPAGAAVVLLRSKMDAESLAALCEIIETQIQRAGGDCRYDLGAEQATFACTAPAGRTLNEFFAPFAGGNVCMALGDVCPTLSESCQHAQLALENRVLAQESLVSYETLERRPGGAVFSQSDLMRLTGCLGNHDEKGVSALVQRLFGLEDGRRISFQYFLSVMSSLTLHLAQFYGKSRESAEKLLMQQSGVMRDIADAGDITDMSNAIENYIYELYSDCIAIGPITRRAELVDKINRSIAANYRQEGFTVEKMASELMYESSYMRRVYKTETGSTIMKALENYRIREAAQLLREGRMRHSDIARSTGFGDPYYFSRRFKQLMGCTPSEYELQAREKDEKNE